MDCRPDDVERSSTAIAATSPALQTQKRVEIQLACDEKDLQSLIRLAIAPHGLLDDRARRVAWPVLLGCPAQTESKIVSWQSLSPHRDEEQVRLDVSRAFIYYPKDESEKEREQHKEELSSLIVEILRRYPELCYFQGYHDIAQVFLLVLGREHATPAVARLSLLRIRDFMLPTLSAAITQLRLLPAIFHALNPQLGRHLAQTQPFFALAATLTLYAHDIEKYGDIARLFDFLLAHEACMSLYLFAVIVASRKEELFEIEPDEPEMLHSILSKLPNPLDLEKRISDAIALYQKCPPDKLPFRAWTKVSSYSALKTTQNFDSLSRQTLHDGAKLFAKQEQQMRRIQMLIQARDTFSKLQRPAGAVTLAVLVAGLSWYLQREASIAKVMRYLKALL